MKNAPFIANSRILVTSLVFTGSTLANGALAPTQNAAVVNVGGGPPTDLGGGDDPFGGVKPLVAYSAPGSKGTYSVHGGTASGSPGSDSGSGGTGGNGTDVGGGDDPKAGSTSGTTSSHHGLSSGIIAVIAVFSLLFLLALILLACRRCAIAKRLSRRKQWFRKDNEQAPGYGATAISSSGFFRANGAPLIRSSTSSFGTMFEHDPVRAGTPPPVPLSSTNWPLYTPQQMTQSNTFGITLPPAASTTSTPPSPTVRSGSRFSSDSLVSLSPNEGPPIPTIVSPVQVLLVPDRNETAEPITPDATTPLSVRPFSPTERWSFPVPPASAEMSPVIGLQALR